MSLDPLFRVFWQPEEVQTEGLTDSGTVMTLPSTLTREMARSLVDELPMNQMVKTLGGVAAKSVGDALQSRGLRPADYKDLHDIPDAVVERLIDALSKKPEIFFQAFFEQLKLQG